MNGIPILENTTNIGVLIFLLDHDGATKQQLYDGYKRSAYLPERLGRLVSAGLITMDEGEEYNNRRGRMHLTPAGRDVAVHLKAVRGIIEGLEDAH